MGGKLVYYFPVSPICKIFIMRLARDSVSNSNKDTFLFIDYVGCDW